MISVDQRLRSCSEGGVTSSWKNSSVWVVNTVDLMQQSLHCSKSVPIPHGDLRVTGRTTNSLFNERDAHVLQQGLEHRLRAREGVLSSQCWLNRPRSTSEASYASCAVEIWTRQYKLQSFRPSMYHTHHLRPPGASCLAVRSAAPR